MMPYFISHKYQQKRITHPSEVLSINQNLEKIKVASIDLEKQRVGLTLKLTNLK